MHFSPMLLFVERGRHGLTPTVYFKFDPHLFKGLNDGILDPI